jgi:hypothetical protein
MPTVRFRGCDASLPPAARDLEVPDLRSPVANERVVLMPGRFLMQPNGKLARFSTIVDMFTHANLTEEEAFNAAFEDMGRSEAEAKVARGVARGVDAEGGWNECLETIRLIHGADKCAIVLAEILGDRCSEPRCGREDVTLDIESRPWCGEHAKHRGSW